MSTPDTSMVGAPTLTEGHVAVSPDLAGKAIDNSRIINRDGADKYRQRINVSDPADPDAHAAVTNTDPDRNAYGMAVRVIPGGADVSTTNDLLLLILGELQAINLKLGAM